MVDDAPGVLTMVESLLTRSGFRVLTAVSGETALSLVSQTNGPIDLLLSDVEMPGMSGADLGEALEKIRPKTPIVLMSAGSNRGAAVSHGWAYIQKPFIPAQLLDLLSTVVGTN